MKDEILLRSELASFWIAFTFPFSFTFLMATNMQECFSFATQTSPKDLRLNPLPSSIPLSQLSDKLVVSSKCGIHPVLLTAKNCNADSESLRMPQFMEFSFSTQTKMNLTNSLPAKPLRNKHTPIHQKATLRNKQTQSTLLKLPSTSSEYSNGDEMHIDVYSGSTSLSHYPSPFSSPLTCSHWLCALFVSSNRFTSFSASLPSS